MTLNQLNPTRRLATPGGMLGLGLLAALLLAALPERWTDPLRDAAAVALQPGQRAATTLRGRGDRAATWVRSHFQTATRLAEAEARLRQLEQQNERLAAELDALRVEAARRSADDPTDAGRGRRPGRWRPAAAGPVRDGPRARAPGANVSRAASDARRRLERRHRSQRVGRRRDAAARPRPRRRVDARPVGPGRPARLGQGRAARPAHQHRSHDCRARLSRPGRGRQPRAARRVSWKGPASRWPGFAWSR